MSQNPKLKKCVICGRKRELVSEYPITGACFDCAMQLLFYAMLLLVRQSLISDPDQVPDLIARLSLINRKIGRIRK